MTIPATGRVVRTGDGQDIVIERTFNAPIADVWASIVEPERMNRWIGTWSGESGNGKRVTFIMTAEEGAPPEEVLIHRCDPPRHLDVESFQGESTWRLKLDLSESDGVTTLVFRQGVEISDEGASSYGPGWEYYLDRLVASRDGTPFASWDEFYPAQLAYWEEQLRLAGTAAPS
jgi:uncharacterized protein YndB with AHSA1/START domain